MLKFNKSNWKNGVFTLDSLFVEMPFCHSVVFSISSRNKRDLAKSCFHRKGPLEVLDHKDDVSVLPSSSTSSTSSRKTSMPQSSDPRKKTDSRSYSSTSGKKADASFSSSAVVYPNRKTSTSQPLGQKKTDVHFSSSSVVYPLTQKKTEQR